MSLSSDLPTRTLTSAMAEAPGSDDLNLAPAIYDRSSLRGEFMVMIAGQTEDDYFRLAPEAQFCEYIDGTVYMPSPVSANHQEIVQFLFHLLDAYRCEREGAVGRILLGPAVLRLRPGRDFEPDLFVLPVGREDRVRGSFSEGPAALIVEVISESTRTHDFQFKANLYREHAIGEIWLVDPRDRHVTISRRVGEGYQEERLALGPCSCATIPGFWFDVAWLWSDPLPNTRRCLEQILAGPPAR